MPPASAGTFEITAHTIVPKLDVDEMEWEDDPSDREPTIQFKRRKDTTSEIVSSVEGIFVFAGQRVPGDRVDREVASARGVAIRHPGIAAHLEALVAAAALRFAAGQRNVDIDDIRIIDEDGQVQES